MPIRYLEITEHARHVVQRGIEIVKTAGSAQRRGFIEEVVDAPVLQEPTDGGDPLPVNWPTLRIRGRVNS